MSLFPVQSYDAIVKQHANKDELKVKQDVSLTPQAELQLVAMATFKCIVNLMKLKFDLFFYCGYGFRTK